MPFSFKSLEIPEVILVEPKVFGDERGFFMETRGEDIVRVRPSRAEVVQPREALHPLPCQC